jgi:hypothetical protein
MSNTFKSDLAFSNKYENELIRILKGHVKAETSQDKGKFSDWDVCFTYADGHTETHEVKCDRNGHKTGNVVIEFECNGQPSGIATSKADYYTFFIITPDEGYTCIILETQHVRNQIAKEKYTRIIDMGQRHNTGKLYLFNIETLVGDCCFDGEDVSSDDSDGEEDTINNPAAAIAAVATDNINVINGENDKTKCTVFAP